MRYIRRMNRMLISLLCASVLTGCFSTYSDVQGRPPALTLRTDKSADEYMSCLQPKFMDIWPGAEVMTDGDVRTLVATEPRIVLVTVTAKPADDGSVIEYRQLNNITRLAFGRARQAAEGCT